MKIAEEMKMMIAELNYHTKLYNEGHPEWSDKQWDEAYFRLEELEKKTGLIFPNSPTQKIIFENVNNLEKVKHNHAMLSLAKTKDWNEFLNYFSSSKDVIGMPKLDGLTCSLRYMNGELVSAETRGDGEIGENILHNAKVISSIPKHISYMEELVIDGEIICTAKNFEEFANEYKNSRNFAAGSIRLLDAEECARRKLTFVVWNVISPIEDINSFFSKIDFVEKLGFIAPPMTSSFDWDAKDYLIDRSKELGYPIDGLVGRYDDVEYGESLGSTSHHANAAYAFKFYDEEYETRLLHIEWSMGRTGVLTPVARFEPIEIDGTTVERASLHNYSVMKEIMGDCCYCGQKLIVYKANMIIPQIKSAVKMNYGDVISHGGITCDGFSNDYGLLCPVCEGGTSLVKSESGTINVVCDNPQCEGKLINRLDHFCGKKGLDIKGLSKATLEKLIDWGWVSNIREIFSLSNFRSEWIKKPGFGVKSVDNILNAIENSKNAKFASVISAFGIPLIGNTVAKDLAKRFENYAEFRKAIEDDFDFSKLNGYGYEMKCALLNFNYQEMDDVVWNCLNLEYDAATPTTETTSLEGLTFVITGKLKTFKNRDELKAAIESRGGKVASAVSSKTNYLVNNDTESTTSKNKTAKELGIPIIDEEQLRKQFDF